MFSVSNKKYHDKVITIPMGVDTKRFYPSDQNILKKEYSEEDLLIFVGRLIDWKGTVFLVEAMKDVVRIFPKTKLLIIGDGPEKNNLITKINELGLQSNIIFIGQIKNTEIRKYYSAADIFIIPSIIVSGHTEGLGVVTIEAMACGTSVIGSDVGGIPDVIQNEYNGFLVSEKSSKELAQKIIKLLSNNDMQNKFNWDVISNQFIKIFY
jgi:glycosyltransferase involved in cell wall biosynthesis